MPVVTGRNNIFMAKFLKLFCVILLLVPVSVSLFIHMGHHDLASSFLFLSFASGMMAVTRCRVGT